MSFIRLGNKQKVSKSETINRALFKGANRVFSEAAFTINMMPKRTSIGLIDLAFAGPELKDTELREPDLPNLLTVLNLHGDANDQRLKNQLTFLRKISNVIVVVP